MSSVAIQTVTEEVKTKPPTSVISVNEVERYHELGLGRALNVTDPEMWKNKSSFLVRKVHPCLENVIGTEDCSVLESYKKEVSTFSMQQQQFRIAVSDPAIQVKIGMDEHYSTSSSSTKLIIGKKIETRTISFMFHPDDVPLYSDIEKAGISAPSMFLSDHICSFEGDLCTWILKRMADRELKANKTPEESVTPCDQAVYELSAKMMALTTDTDWREKIISDCTDFVKTIGVTHYISAIKLGACHYLSKTTSTKQERLGAGASVGASPYVEGYLSGFLAKTGLFRKEEEKKIGRIDDEHETVEREAVIGFQIQPLHQLVRIQLLQMALRKAIKEFIKKKEDKSGK